MEIQKIIIGGYSGMVFTLMVGTMFNFSELMNSNKIVFYGYLILLVMVILILLVYGIKPATDNYIELARKLDKLKGSDKNKENPG